MSVALEPVDVLKTVKIQSVHLLVPVILAMH